MLMILSCISSDVEYPKISRFSRAPVPQPALAFLVAYKRPYFINVTNQLNLQVVQGERCYTPHRDAFSVRTATLILTCNTRAVSRIHASQSGDFTLWATH